MKTVWRILKKLKIKKNSERAKNKSIVQATYTILSHMPKGLCTLLHRYLLGHAHYYFIHNSYEMETT